MSGRRETALRLEREAEALGATVVGWECGGRHSTLVLRRASGRALYLPVATLTGRGRARQLSNAVAQLRRLLRQP